jgi:adenylyl-sulfate kinase
MKPTVVWITGLSGAGKTTVANALFEKCKEQYKTGIADGDIIRAQYEKPKGFDMLSRQRMVMEMVYRVRNMIEWQKNDIVIVAMISPLQSMRDEARKIITSYCNAKFIEVYMDTPLEICEQRDPKGLYKKARAGEIKNFTGIDSIYEPATHAEVIIPFNSTVDQAIEIVYNTII